MLETIEVLSPGDLVSLRIEGEEEQSRPIVLHGRTVRDRAGRGRYNRYGVAFLPGRGQSYERLRRSREVAHAKAVAEALELMFVEITPSMVEKRALGYINRDLAFSLNCIPIKLRDERLMVAMVDPGDPRALKKLELFSRCNISPVVATPSAIRNALMQSFGAQYVPSGRDGSEAVSLRRSRQESRPRIVALTSSTPGFRGETLATNLAAVLNTREKRALLLNLYSEGSTPSDRGSGTTTEPCEWLILGLSMDRSPFFLDWAIRAHETFLVVSPSHWKRGCLYVEAVFNRFVEVEKQRRASFQDWTVRQRVLALSVVCAQISDMQEGFKIFSRMERSVHQQLDMREPGLDIRLHYVGGILDDRKNIRKAETTGIPLTVLKPHSPASQCMIHIAQSMLRPYQARDPRIHFSRSLVSRIFG